MIIGMPARAADSASTRSPRWAVRALTPIGAMPNGAFHSRPNNIFFCDRPATLFSTRGRKRSSSKAARLSRLDAPVSAAPAT